MDGTFAYGLIFESVMDRILEYISSDDRARLLVDVHVDSSKRMESLFSTHLRDVLDVFFSGNTLHRDEVNVIIADLDGFLVWFIISMTAWFGVGTSVFTLVRGLNDKTDLGCARARCRWER
jgi:hypothetical protein